MCPKKSSAFCRFYRYEIKNELADLYGFMSTVQTKPRAWLREWLTSERAPTTSQRCPSRYLDLYLCTIIFSQMIKCILKTTHTKFSVSDWCDRAAELKLSQTRSACITEGDKIRRNSSSYSGNGREEREVEALTNRTPRSPDRLWETFAA